MPVTCQVMASPSENWWRRPEEAPSFFLPGKGHKHFHLHHSIMKLVKNLVFLGLNAYSATRAQELLGSQYFEPRTVSQEQCDSVNQDGDNVSSRTGKPVLKVNCIDYCQTCGQTTGLRSKAEELWQSDSLVKELRCHEKRDQECKCDLTAYCVETLKRGNWKTSLKSADAHKGRTIVIIDESASISNKRALAGVADAYGGRGFSRVTGVVTQFVVKSYNKWLEYLRDSKEVKREDWVHDRLTVLKFNEEFEIMHTNAKDEAQKLNRDCNYYPERNTKLRDAIGCVAHMYQNECNNKVIMFSDGEENSSVEFSRDEIAKNGGLDPIKTKYYELLKNRGWNLFYAYTWKTAPDVHSILHDELSQLVNASTNIFELTRDEATLLSWLHQEDKGVEFSSYPSFFNTDMWASESPDVANLRRKD